MDGDVANAMGFATMCRLAGVGIGNLVAGSILDAGRTTDDSGRVVAYSYWAYALMCVSCGVLVFIAAWLLEGVASLALAKGKEGDD